MWGRMHHVSHPVVHFPAAMSGKRPRGKFKTSIVPPHISRIEHNDYREQPLLLKETCRSEKWEIHLDQSVSFFVRIDKKTGSVPVGLYLTGEWNPM